MISPRRTDPVLILVTSHFSVRGLRRALPRAGISEWVALIPGYSTIASLDAQLRDVASRRAISADLQRQADSLRRHFITLTAQFSKSYGHSLAWWASGIAERCTNVSNLFLYCCYFFLAREYLDGRDACIVCDYSPLRRMIASLARRNGYRVRRPGWSIPSLRENPLWPIAALAAKLGLTALRWLIVRLARLGSASRQRREADVLLSTWVDTGGVDAAGRVQDRFFPGLSEFYASHGLTAATIATSIEGLLAFSRTAWCLRNNDSYLLPEAWVRFSDLGFPMWLWFHQRRFRFEEATLQGVKVGVLFTAAKWNDAIPFGACLMYPMIRRLTERGVRPRLMVLGFENMVSDKMTILAVRAFMPGTAIYGFCHNPLKRNVLSWYTDTQERDIAPLPDRVIANGALYRDILVQEHYPSDRVVIGTALRYTYLHHKGNSGASGTRNGGRPRVLVVLTLKADATLEVVEKVIPALREVEEAEVLVKAHPFAPHLGGAILSTLEGRAEVVRESMSAALAKADVVICAASGAVLEAVLAGKSVLRVSHESQLDMDPLAWFPEFGQPVASSAELAIHLRTLIHQDAKASQGMADDLGKYFAPPTETNMQVFLPTRSTLSEVTS